MTCDCLFCSASGFGATGWTTVCPTCQASPARQAWHVELRAIGCAMALEAFGRGFNPATHSSINPEIEARWRALSKSAP